MNLNYSVQVLLYRYALAVEAIEEYYIGTVFAEDIEGEEAKKGAIVYTKADVESLYFSDKCVRVLRMQLQTAYDNDPTERLERARNAVIKAASNGESAVAMAMIGAGSITSAKETQDGFVMGRHNLDAGIYGEMTDAAFSLGSLEVSQPIKINDGSETYHVILYRADKSSMHFEACYPSIVYIFLKDSVGEIMDNTADAMLDSLEIKDFFKTLDKSTITME